MHIGAGQLDHHCTNAGVGVLGKHPLRVPEIRSTPHAETPVKPGLLPEPAERVDPIGLLAPQRVVGSTGIVPAARRLYDDVVASLRPEAADDGAEQIGSERFRVWYPHQHRRGRQVGNRVKNLRDERNSVRGEHYDVSVASHRELGGTHAKSPREPIRRDRIGIHGKQYSKQGEADRRDNGYPVPDRPLRPPLELQIGVNHGCVFD